LHLIPRVPWRLYRQRTPPPGGEEGETQAIPHGFAKREGAGPLPVPQSLPGKGMVASTTVGSEASGGGHGACWKVLPPGKSASHPVYPLIFSLAVRDACTPLGVPVRACI
jgi:hypothetical protein